MIQSLSVLLLRLDVLEENNLKEESLEEDVDQTWTHLHDSYVEEEGRTQKRQMNVVIHAGEGVILFVR